MTEHLRTPDLESALERLAENPEFVPVAGCTDLMVTTPEARADLPAVLDLGAIPALSGIEAAEDGALVIGATTTFREIGDHPVVRAHYPALAQAARVVGGWQIQNRATLGGNIANASPAGDSLPVLLALDAELELARHGGRRRVPYASFHVGYRETALAPGELIARVHLPRPAAGTRQAFRKVGTREAQAISKVVVAGSIASDGGRIREARLAAGSVAATPIRLREVEEMLRDADATPEVAERAGGVASRSVEPIDDVRSSAAYRRWVLGRVVRRIVLEVLGLSAP